MIEKVRAYIREQNMLCDGDKVVVGVSGGADSMCLLSCLMELRKEYRLELFVVHVNHGIRGEEAREDAEYVTAFCKANGIPVRVKEADVKSLAKKEGLSEEEAGRKVRYEEFEKECRIHECGKIAIAHNENDNAETVLFHLFRGSGIRGISGIKPTRGMIIRPLLTCLRSEIEAYLERKGIPFRTDATNLTEDYSRNKIRRRVLPYVEEEINKKAVEHVVSLAAEMAQIDDFLDQYVMNEYNRIVTKTDTGYSIELSGFSLLNQIIKQRLVQKVLEHIVGGLKNIERKHILDIISLENKQVGKQIMLPYHIFVKRGYTTFDVCLLNKMERTYVDEIPCEIPGDCYIGGLDLRLELSIENYKKNMRIPQNGYTKWFDYDKIRNAIVVRTRRTGDFLQINQSGGRKSLKSVMIDKKIPKEQRDEVCLLAAGDHILWILGDRGTEGFFVEDTTKRILVARLCSAGEK